MRNVALPPSLVDEVMSSSTPTWVIDVREGRLLAANAGGTAQLGIALPAGGTPLDLAMPALIRLREMVREGSAGEEHRASLVFWTSSGAVRQACQVRLAADAQRDTVVLVRAEPVSAPVARPLQIQPINPAADPAAALGPPIPRDDQETLREIARRILNASRQPKEQPPIDLPEDEAGAGIAANVVKIFPAPRREEPPPPGLPQDPRPPVAADPAGPVTPDEPIAAIEPPLDPIAPPSPAAGPVPTAGASVRDGDEVKAPAITSALRSSLAHELKSPLSAIAAAAEIMRDERLGPMANPRYREYAANIHDTARHALDVINRMLAQPSGEAEHGALDFRTLDLNAIAQETVRAFTPLAAAAGLTLDCELDPELPPVVADATSLRQILSNLITNALKFTPHGGQVVVATKAALGGPITIEVRDTGRGMTSAEIASALEADTRPRQMPRDGGGLGLGLPLVRHLSERNGARLTIDSSPGKGTKAVVSFARNRLILV